MMEFNRIEVGDAVAVLAAVPDGVFQCCVTSPPYWGLRDYGHPGQIGLEPTPEAYVARLVAVFREVRRTLADDGVLWLNIGDSYANDGKWGGSTGGKHAAGLHGTNVGRGKRTTGLKPKDLVGIPWMVAFALRADGWWLRSDVIWEKPNAMPESVEDRPTKAHEYVFLLSKAERYFYDAKAIQEPMVAENAHDRGGGRYEPPGQTPAGSRADGGRGAPASGMRNARTVWSIATEPYAGAHFAVMPPALAMRCVLAGSRPGDVVLDPFMGSGTVGAVAEKCGRRWFGCDVNPEYAPLAAARTAQRGLNFGGQK